MIGRLVIVALAVGLSACAGLEPAGRNASRSPRATASTPAPTPAPPSPTPAPPVPAVVVERPLPPPPQVATPPAAPVANPTPAAPTPQRAAAPVETPQVAAPRVTAPPPTTPAPTAPRQQASTEEDIVVPGQVRTQVPAPQGDPRSNEERRADVRSWDQCVMQVQNAFDADPMRPQFTTPEEYCASSLGMADRTAIPISRQQRRR